MGGMMLRQLNPIVAGRMREEIAGFEAGIDIFNGPRVHAIRIDPQSGAAALVVDYVAGDTLKDLIATNKLTASHLKTFDSFVSRVIDSGQAPLDLHPGNFKFSGTSIRAFDASLVGLDQGLRHDWFSHTLASREIMVKHLLASGRIQSQDPRLSATYMRKVRGAGIRKGFMKNVRAAAIRFMAP